ncbi:cell wall-active antibiotics response protein LiaF [Paenibacillus koleovorans]|uniref:cell wall-active antibiotics response protein LiaF n=1 Tax=Paenibacillus koleovorans TaxID=121608 RepID=UPI001FEC7B63|nr:cell wall-active antibiotics response protein LiaF [Paenibacillus koleovorans]
MRNDIWGKVFGGLVLIAVGVVFLLNQLDILTVDIGYVFANYWPVILIIFGLKGILIQRRLDYGWGGSYLWNVIIAVVGLVFLNNNLHWLGPINFRDVFKFLVPVILIALGLNMLLRPKRSRCKPPKPPKHNARQPQAADPIEEETNWTPPAEAPFQPYTSYGPTPDNEQPQPTSHNNANGVGQAPPPPPPPGQSSPYPPQGSNLEDKPPIVKDFIGWKEQFKRDWKESWDQQKHHYKQHHERHQRHQHRHHGHQHDHQWHQPAGADVQHRHNFIGDLHVGQDYWELTNMNISHFIGDTELDLTRAQIPYGETRINISAFIGDVKVYVPNDVQLEVSVTASSFLGDINVFERREGGMFRSMQAAAPAYTDAEKRVRIVVSMFIGDVRVKRVG